jgi:hypothetical protein
MRTIFSIMLLGVIALVAAPDSNVSGKWSGSFNLTRPDGETKDSTAVLLLKQTGTEISGSVGPNEEEQHAITKGSIAGDKITLEAADEGRVIRFDLVLAGDRITGEANMTNEGQTTKAKLDVTRVK